MEIDLLQDIEVFDSDGTLIKNKQGGPPPLKEVLLIALRSPHNSDASQGFREKNERYLMAKRITASDKIALTKEEAKLLKERVGMMFMQMEIVGRVGEILDEAEGHS